jgi:DNA polymerase-3 subunit gamma/tau
MPGGIDTDAIRRSWPDILTKIASISRVTWSFVSQNTKVLDYDGTRLLLGLSTEGLLSTLRGRNHAEVVRQALIEVIGVDTRVDGVLATDPVTVDQTVAAAQTQGPSDLDDPEPDDVPDPPAEPSDLTGTEVPDRNGPSSPAAPGRPSTPMQRARAAVAQEASTRSTGISPSVADDSMVSADDEDIDEEVAVGQPVIARVLGGTVIGELDQ